VAFSFLAIILMLNVLIAVVSDSYDYATASARPLFLIARTQLVNEFDAIGWTDERHWFNRLLLHAQQFTGNDVESDKQVTTTRPRNDHGSDTSPASWAGADEVEKLRLWSMQKLAWLLQAGSGDTSSEGDEWLGRILNIEKRVRGVVGEAQEHSAQRLAETEKRLEALITQVSLRPEKGRCAYAQESKGLLEAMKAEKEDRSKAVAPDAARYEQSSKRRTEYEQPSKRRTEYEQPSKRRTVGEEGMAGEGRMAQEIVDLKITMDEVKGSVEEMKDLLAALTAGLVSKPNAVDVMPAKGEDANGRAAASKEGVPRRSLISSNI